MEDFFKNFLDKMNINDNSDDDYYDDDEAFENDYDDEPVKKKALPFLKKDKSSDNIPNDEPAVKPAREKGISRQGFTKRSSGKVVNFGSYANNGGNIMEVKVIKPVVYDDSRDICDTLKDGLPIVLNLEGVRPELAQRIIDFTSGSVYALEGTLQKVADNIILVTPNGISVSGNFGDYLPNGEDFSNVHFDTFDK